MVKQYVSKIFIKQLKLELEAVQSICAHKITKTFEIYINEE